jgi:RNA polymerase sigma factor (sigma-70 family)
MVGHSGYGMIQRLHSLLAHADSDERSDGELLCRFAGQADADAFAVIVRRHGPMVLGVCRRLLHNSADADDAFQATFAVLIRKAASLSRPQQLAGWLFQVAYRTARRARAARLRRQARQIPLHEIPVEAPIADVVWRELKPIFDEEVNRLPEKLRLPVVLCYMEGRTKRAAAQALGWPEGTLSCRLQQARELLQSRLARRGVTASAGALTLALGQGTASAAVPTSLVSSTVQSASLIAAGSAVAGPVATLTQGVLHSMFMTKLKIVAALTLTIGLLGGGTGWVLSDGIGGWAWAQEPSGQRSGLKAQGATKEIETKPRPRGAEAELFKEPPYNVTAKNADTDATAIDATTSPTKPVNVTAKNADTELNKALDSAPNEQAAESRSTTLILTDGRTFSGRVVRETPTEIELQLPDESRKVVKVADIDERKTVPWGNKLFVPKDTPPIVVHDFGTVPWGTRMTHRFMFTNIYAVPIQIMEAPRVSCGCVQIVRFTEKLEPHETGSIDVEVDGRRFEGAKAFSIRVLFGPWYQSEAQLQVRAVSRTEDDQNQDDDLELLRAIKSKTDAKAGLAQAGRNLASAEIKAKQFKELFVEGAVPKEVLDRAIAEADLAVAKLKQAQATLERTQTTLNQIRNQTSNDQAPAAKRNEPPQAKELPKNATGKKIDGELLPPPQSRNSTTTAAPSKDVELAKAGTELNAAYDQLAAAEDNLVKSEAELRRLIGNGVVGKEFDIALGKTKDAGTELERAQAAVDRARAKKIELHEKATKDRLPMANHKESTIGTETPVNARPKNVDLELPVAQILEQDAKIDVRTAENDLANWEIKIDRLKKQFAEGFVAKPMLDEAIADRQVADAKLRQARARLQRAQATLNQLNQSGTRAPRSSEPGADRKEEPVKDAEARLERLTKLNAIGAASDVEVDRARIIAAEVRIIGELRTIVFMREKNMERARHLLPANLITNQDFQKAGDALDAAKRRLAEAKLVTENELRNLVDALDAAK